MRDSLRLILSVLVTCLVAASGLAVTYAFTAPRIAEQDRLAEERSLKAVVSEADSFEQLEDASLLERANGAADPVEVRGVYKAVSGTEHIGWAVRVASRGYGGPMQLVIGLDTSGSVTGVSVLTHNETPGLGTKVLTEAGFMEQFATLQPGFTDRDVRGLDVIAGSTRSSNGIRNGVAAAGRVFTDVLGEEGGAQ